MLGSPSVYLDEHPISQEINTKAQALLYYLVITGRTHYRNELASLFWPDMPDVQARKNLRNILPVLRACVGSHIVVTRDTAVFDRYAPYWIDVEAFEALMGIERANASTESLWAAVALYDDDFLTGFYVRNAPLFEEWMLLKRERLRDMLIDTLQTLATRHLRDKEYHAALNATRRLLNIEPWRESGHLQQMQALVGLGQRTAALAQYDACCRILAAEFNITPGAEMMHLYEQIKTVIAPEAQTPMHPDHRHATSSTPEDSSMLPAKAAALPIALSMDGRLLAVPDKHHTIRLANLSTCRSNRILGGHNGTITALCFSPNSKLLASASADQTVRLWSMSSGALLATLSGHSAAVTAVTFCSTGSTLASASADQTVRLWNVANGAMLSILRGHMVPVIHIAFLPENTGLVGVDSDHVVMFWDFTDEPVITNGEAIEHQIYPLDLPRFAYIAHHL